MRCRAMHFVQREVLILRFHVEQLIYGNKMDLLTFTGF
ncbi:Uncharacterised protein [Vibrio cholerae]|nr:Uncharacterised protein [Vibrio cholerae]CRZ84535.1 Uncharacterised protein [Vibrio cholerae]